MPSVPQFEIHRNSNFYSQKPTSKRSKIKQKAFKIRKLNLPKNQPTTKKKL
jgi:hypothetical protein